jgi:hypothetical protein
MRVGVAVVAVGDVDSDEEEGERGRRKARPVLCSR